MRTRCRGTTLASGICGPRARRSSQSAIPSRPDHGGGGPARSRACRDGPVGARVDAPGVGRSRTTPAGSVTSTSSCMLPPGRRSTTRRRTRASPVPLTPLARRGLSRSARPSSTTPPTTSSTGRSKRRTSSPTSPNRSPPTDGRSLPGSARSATAAGSSGRRGSSAGRGTTSSARC